MSVDLSIAIPFRNEAESLRVLLPEIIREARALERPFEVLLVDDASTDDGAAVVREFAEGHPQVRLLRLGRHGGQTEAFRLAFEEARGRHLIRMDADLQDDPADLKLFADKIDQGYDVVMGMRESRKHGRMLRVASGVYDLLILLLFDSPLHCHSGSYVAFRTDLVRGIPFRKNDHRYVPLIAIHRGAEKVGEVIVRHRQRRFGASKYDPVKKLVLGVPEVLFFLLRLRRGCYRMPASEDQPLAREASL